MTIPKDAPEWASLEPYPHGSRTTGPHENVRDYRRPLYKLALCVCHDCQGTWDEGGFYPPKCKSRRFRFLKPKI